MIRIIDATLQRARLVVGATLVAALALGTFSVASAQPHRDDHHWDHRDYDHRDYDHGGDHGGWNGGYYAPPPVVYGAPVYAAPPVVYGPSVGITLPGVSIGIQ